jgi:hypothetical protein
MKIPALPPGVPEEPPLDVPPPEEPPPPPVVPTGPPLVEPPLDVVPPEPDVEPPPPPAVPTGPPLVAPPLDVVPPPLEPVGPSEVPPLLTTPDDGLPVEGMAPSVVPPPLNVATGDKRRGESGGQSEFEEPGSQVYALDGADRALASLETHSTCSPPPGTGTIVQFQASSLLASFEPLHANAPAVPRTTQTRWREERMG